MTGSRDVIRTVNRRDDMSAPLIRQFALAAALACTAAPALAGKAPDNLVPAGKPVDCVQLNAIRSTEVRDDRTIDFIMNGNKVYRNILPMSCPSLGFERRFLYKTSLSQLCSVDIITVLYQTGGLQRGPSCGLGKFQPMQKMAK
ncbi:hypothetical protein A0J57_02895 [Sphingobium sp. 22B]|uniref:Uncharacterized protein n=2 Tax=Sphingomonadaceae TaxID=41297 RepID=A0A5B8CH57_SPHSA|nr:MULTISPECIES: hypothetical protein [Sphingobium]OAP33968.1 hypothetical protein A8O16_02115 [Sphingobium sp. 20006FA]KXU30775.1 hypothetical protein AXW74_15995 [Sphingobium sp. AM]KYC34355.1 hypothetical protein A0J57_02895 [Sphingobium sp. 22B]MCB4859980.1 hypothetical protein [Sphingobium sp. PNB]PNQ01440.1 hypothetical protein A8G00_04550 [Sphingobium sp. SA916]